MSEARISRIIYKQGITGVVVTFPATHLRLNWDHVAGVTLGGDLLAPPLHRVMADIYYNLRLALKMVKRHSYRRIGTCLTELLDRSAVHSARAAAFYFNATIPKAGKVVPPLSYRGEDPRDWPTAKEQIAAWMSCHRPDVIVCHSSQIVACVCLAIPRPRTTQT